MKKVWIVGLVLLNIMSIFGIVVAQETAITVEEVVQIALEQNPQIKAAQKKVAARQARIKSVSSLPDPWVGLEYENMPQGSFSYGETGMKMYSFSQMVPWPGKLSLRAKIGRTAAGISEEGYRMKQREIISQVKQAYFELYFAYKSLEVNNENRQLLEQIAKVSERKYSVGKANLSEVLKAQVELSKLSNELITLENNKQTAQAKLNILLNRPPEQEFGIPQYQGKPFSYKLAELYTMAKSYRPELKVSSAAIKESELNVSLAKREYLPDFMVTYKQRIMDGESAGWDGMLGVTVPLWFWRNQKYMVEEMKAEKEMALADYKDMENMVLFEVKQMYVKVDAAERKVALSKDTIIPQTEQVLRVSQTGYEADKVEFLELLDSQRMYLEAELDYYMNIVDLEMAKAELEQMVGKDLEGVAQ